MSPLPAVSRRLTVWAPLAVIGLVVAAVLGRPLPAGAAPAGPDGAAAPAQPGLNGWRGVTVAGATCGRGAPYKYYLNAAAAPTAGLVVVLSGGGACLKDGHAPPGATGVARQLYCMDYDNFTDPSINDATMLTGLVPAAVPYLRREAANPFRDYTYAVLPYCTGDVHSGGMTAPYDYDPDPATTFEVVHRGALNVAAVLDDLRRQFPDDQPVVLTGLSAGGFGAIFNFPAVVARWPRTSLIPDAGIAPSHPLSLLSREGQRLADRWGARALLPPYCQSPECLASTLQLLAAHAGYYDGDPGPWRPFGYLQGQQDGTLADYLEISRCSYQLGLRRDYVVTRQQANLRAWLPATSDHVFSFRAGYRTPGGQVAMFPWFTAVATAATAGDLPPDAVDPWGACYPLSLPLALHRQ